jgi:hypothetical protein
LLNFAPSILKNIKMKRHLLLCMIVFLGFAVSAQRVRIDSGLVACYPFNGNANDMTGNGHNGTVVGATLVPDRFGNANSAYQFADNTGSYINVPNFSSILTANDIAISFWSQANSNTSDQPFMAQPDVESNRFGIAVNYTSVGAIWDYGDLTSSSGRMSYNTGYSTSWQHYVFQVSQTQNLKQIYLNGVLIDSSPYGMAYNASGTSLNIGGANVWSGGWAGFPGVIDDIRIYNRALNQKEVDSLYHAPSTGLSCNTLGMNDIEGSAPYIYSPNLGVVNMSFGRTPFKGTLQVYNMLGQKMDEKTLDAPANSIQSYTLQHGATGMYILVLTSESVHYSFKFER